ncbi:MAG TPA: hypothetical protein VNT81_14040 [Vicinamibacterales bacterium]|nr:hypothetical protein [Vicinamibacterales bacterium]
MSGKAFVEKMRASIDAALKVRERRSCQLLVHAGCGCRLEDYYEPVSEARTAAAAVPPAPSMIEALGASHGRIEPVIASRATRTGVPAAPSVIDYIRAARAKEKR